MQVMIQDTVPMHREGSCSVLVQKTPKHKILNTKEFYYPEKAMRCYLCIRQRQTANGRFYLVFGGVSRKGGISSRVSWKVLIGQVTQCSQIMNFDCWTLVFSLRIESVNKRIELGWEGRGIDLGM